MSRQYKVETSIEIIAFKKKTYKGLTKTRTAYKQQLEKFHLPLALLVQWHQVSPLV